MNISPYQTIRESIMIDNDFNVEDVNNNAVPWNRVLGRLNEIVSDTIESKRRKNIENKDFYYGCITKEFKSVLKEEENNKVPDLIEKCKQTKIDFLVRLFEIPDNKRKKDFNPKTKDFLAMYCSGFGWQDFSADRRGEIHETEEIEFIENPELYISNNIDSIKKFINKYSIEKKNQILDLNKTIRNHLDIKSETHLIIDILNEFDDFLDLSIPPIANEEKLKLAFNKIVEAQMLTLSQKKTIESFMGEKGKEKWQWQYRSAITSALTISIIKHFDEAKARYLIDLIIEDEGEPNSDVWQKALIGLILGFFYVNNYQNLSVLKRKIKSIAKIEKIRNAISIIINKLLNSQLRNLNINQKKLDYFDETYKYFIPFYANSNSFKEASQKENEDIELIVDYISNSYSLTDLEKYSIMIRCPLLVDKKVEQEIWNLFYSDLANWLNKDEKDLNALVFNHIIDDLFFVINHDRSLINVKRIESSKSIQDQALFLNYVSNSFIEYFSLGYYFEQRGQLSKALKNYKKHETVDANNYDNLKHIADCLRKLEKIEEAIEYHEKLNIIDPYDYGNVGKLGFCFRLLKNYKKAIENQHIAVKGKLNNSWNLQEIGNCYQKLEEYREAINYYKNADKEDPNNAQCLTQIGLCFQKLGETKQAIKYFEKVKKLESKNS